MADTDQSLNVLRYNQVSGALEGFGGGSPQWTPLTLTNTDPSQVPTSRTISTTAPLTGGGDLSTNRTIAIPAATSLVNGYLTSADWTTFNSKQAAGSYITALTGDVTASGPGSAAATLASTAVTPGSYTCPSITVDAKGRLTAAATVNFVDNEVPSGTVNGSNVTFTLANAPAPATSLKLYKNGLRLKVTDDYSLSSATITMVSAPLTNDKLIADYRY